jgi:hypothetical protein
VDPVPDSENLVAPGIEPGPLVLWRGTLSTRPERRSEVCNSSKYLKVEIILSTKRNILGP